MKVTTEGATAENGQVQLPEIVKFPEDAEVKILLPGLEVTRTYHMRSPRLTHPEQAVDFVLKVTEELPDATV